MKAPKHNRQALRRIRRRMEKAGVTERVAAVSAAAARVDFRLALNEAITEGGDHITDMAQVRTLAERLLDGRGVDRTGVILTFAWAPTDGRKLTVNVRPDPVIVTEIARAAKLRV